MRHPSRDYDVLMWLTCPRCGTRFEAFGRDAHCPKCPREPATDNGPTTTLGRVLIVLAVYPGIVVFIFGLPGWRFGRGFRPLFLCAGVGLFLVGLALVVVVDKVRAAWGTRRRPRDYHGPNR